MAGSFESYEHLERYPLDEQVRAELYRQQLECVVAWNTRDGWPMAVVHWFVWERGRFWVTAAHLRSRVAAMREDPRSSVVVSSAGTRLGPARTVTARTTATVHDDDATKAWFFPALAARAWGHDPAGEAAFREMLFETGRVVIELEPVGYVTYDSVKMHEAIEAARTPST